MEKPYQTADCKHCRAFNAFFSFGIVGSREIVAYNKHLAKAHGIKPYYVEEWR